MALRSDRSASLQVFDGCLSQMNYEIVDDRRTKLSNEKRLLELPKEPPLFRFGDYVYCRKLNYSGVVTGIVWQKNNPNRADGWWYWVKNNHCFTDHHQRNLELDDDL